MLYPLSYRGEAASKLRAADRTIAATRGTAADLRAASSPLRLSFGIGQVVDDRRVDDVGVGIVDDEVLGRKVLEEVAEQVDLGIDVCIVEDLLGLRVRSRLRRARAR